MKSNASADGKLKVSNSDQLLPRGGAMMMPADEHSLSFRSSEQAAEPPDGFDEGVENLKEGGPACRLVQEGG